MRKETKSVCLSQWLPGHIILSNVSWDLKL